MVDVGFFFLKNSFLVTDKQWWWVVGRHEWLTVKDVSDLLLVVLAKVGGGDGGGTVMVASGMALLFLFLIYFRKLNNKRLKIRFELNWHTYDKFLLVEHGVEQDRRYRRFRGCLDL